MSCPSIERIAAGDADGHLAGCPRCAVIARDQQQIIELAGRLSEPVLHTRRRAALLAEVLAGADAPVRRSSWLPIAGGLAAAATIAAIVYARHASTPPAPIAAITPAPIVPARSAPAPIAPVPIAPAPIASIAPVPIAPSPIAPPRAPVAAEVVGRASFTRASVAMRDTLRLAEGEIVIDARDREPVAVVTGTTTIAIANARVSITAHRGVIVATRVFAGSVELASAEGHRVIETGEIWSRPLDRPPATAAEVSLSAFRTGWEALRGGLHPEAIAAFDRATDEVVAEDAAFWATVAADRAGDVPEAVRRLRAFLDRFPASPHADVARDTLARIAP